MRLYCTDSVQEKLKEYLLTSLNKLIEFLPCDDQSINRKANEMSELGWHVARLQSELEKISADRDDLQRQLTEVRKKQNEWEQVLLDLLSTVHLEEKGTLCETLNSLIDCHVDIALDPRVSKRAKELIQQKAKQAEAVITKNEEVIAALQEQVHTSNTDLKNTKSQRDQAIATAESLRAEYLKHKEMANVNSDNAASLREQLRDMTSERDTFWNQCDSLSAALREMESHRNHANAQWVQCCGDRSRQVTNLRKQLQEMTAQRDTLGRYRDAMRVSRDEARKNAAKAKQDLLEMTDERNAAKEELAQVKEGADLCNEEVKALREAVSNLRATQLHEDMSGILRVIQRAVEQARELI